MYATTSLEGIIVVHRNVIWNNNFDSNSTEIINARSSELFWWTIKAIDLKKKIDVLTSEAFAAFNDK